MSYLRLGILLVLFNAFNLQAQLVKIDLSYVDKWCSDTIEVNWGTLIVHERGNRLKRGVDFNIDSMNCLVFNGRRDSIRIVFRRVDLVDFKDIRNRSSKDLISFQDENDGLGRNFGVKKNNPYDLFPNSGISAFGNMSRGIGFGNNQNLVVNSNLNLQLNGKLGDGVNLLAAISDESNPIQPEGNTQQLQDFDQVYLKFYKKKNSLIIGDFPLQNLSDNYFLKFNKKSRGLSLSVEQKKGNGITKYKGSAAVSRGKFARNIIQGIEGNQGPYQLSGSNGEIYLLILAGSERVFLDGKLLRRGENHDYIIDYNSGELTFTATSLITSYSRIVVEFQYSDRNYSRMMGSAEFEHKIDKWTIRGGYYLEQDNKNQPFQQSLDIFDSLQGLSARQILKEAGDDESKSIINSYEQLSSFDLNRINYRKIDTLGYQDVFVYSPSPNIGTVFYAADFSFVGSGNGNYVVKSSAANGRVFEFVEPVLGQSVGDYEPVQELVSPKRNQMLATSLTYSPNKNLKVQLEVAGSSFDKNTFSDVDNADNNGWAGSALISNKSKLWKDSTLDLQTNVKYEHVQKDFLYIERYRSVEFERQWDRGLGNPIKELSSMEEDLLRVNNVLSRGNKLKVVSTFDYFNRGSSFIGLSHDLMITKKIGSFDLNANHVINSTESNSIAAYRGDFNQYFVELVKNWDKIKTAVGYALEGSIKQYDTSSNYTFGSYSTERRYAYISLPYAKANKLELRVENRLDNRPIGESLESASIGNNINLHWDLNQTKNRITADVQWRRFEVKDSFGFLGDDEDNLLSKIQYRFKWLNKSIVGNTFVHIGTGREQRREYTYLEVPAGTGFYTWIDYNSNEIKELNEFEVAVFKDNANYIRIVTPTNQFVKSNTQELNQTLKIKSPKQWRKKKGMLKFASRFSANMALRLSRKITDNSLEQLLNPFSHEISDSSLIYSKLFFKNTYFFNRLSRVYSFEVTTINNSNKVFLNNGFDSRFNEALKVKGRLNINSHIAFIPEYERGGKGLTSEFFSTRDFDYTYSKWSPSVQWVLSRSFRLNFAYAIYEAENAANLGGEKSSSGEFVFQTVYNALDKGSIDFNLRWTEMKFDGIEGTSLSYDMLSGLTSGSNLVWSLGMAKRFSNHLQLQLLYNGRKNGANDVIHIGNVSARYLF